MKGKKKQIYSLTHLFFLCYELPILATLPSHLLFYSLQYNQLIEPLRVDVELQGPHNLVTTMSVWLETLIENNYGVRRRISNYNNPMIQSKIIGDLKCRWGKG